jgi:hypothetical protein
MLKRLTQTVAGLALLTSSYAIAQDEVTFDPAAIAQVVSQVNEMNDMLANSGSNLRLDYPWFFVVGKGTDPFARLRTGSRWPIASPEYIIDISDLTTDVAPADAEAALVSSYESWNNIGNTYLDTVRVADGGGNYDVLDGTFGPGGECLTIFDISSPNLDLVAEEVFPEADIVVGGWVDENYFVECLGSASIIGVTWSFSDADTIGDNYADRVYVEQFYNEAFDWVTTGSVFLDGTTGTDIETIAVHENGHAHGLGHFGGPVNQQPFKVKPNDRVFNPEAVMNPFYLGGEDRAPHYTDVAGFRTMYAR